MRSNWNDWVLLGAGTCVGFLVGGSYFQPTPFRELLLGVPPRLQWEALLAAGLAMGAAGVTVGTMRQQMRQAESHRVDERQRRGRAAQASLPFALSLVSDYATACVELMRMMQLRIKSGKEWASYEEMQEIVAGWKIPDFDSDALSTLKECIEYSDEDGASALSLIISLMDRQRGLFKRYQSLMASGAPMQPRNFYFILLMSLEIHARAHMLFAFAHADGVARHRVSYGEMMPILAHYLLDDKVFPDFWAEFTSKYSHSLD